MTSRTTEITTITTNTNGAGGSNSVGVIFIKKQEVNLLKTFKRIIAVLSLIIIVLAVSYFVYTAKQIPQENIVSEVLYEVATTA